MLKRTEKNRKTEKTEKTGTGKPRISSGRYILIALLILCLSAAGGIGGACWAANAGLAGGTVAVSSGSAAVSSAKDISGIAQKMTKSVVAITTEEMQTDNFWFGSQVSSGAGSGVIMSSDGYIITCAHVVAGASKITVTTSDSKTCSAKLIGAYTQGDIAVIKINAGNLTAATFADSSKLVQGQTAYAVGNPEGTFSDSITSGIVSALNRKITISLDSSSSGGSDSYGSDSSYSGSSFWGGMQQQTQTATLSVIQTDAAVSPGNSGGGLFNASGELIGIVNAKSSDTYSEGLGFAIPSNTALKTAKELRSGKLQSA